LVGVINVINVINLINVIKLIKGVPYMLKDAAITLLAPPLACLCGVDGCAAQPLAPRVCPVSYATDLIILFIGLPLCLQAVWMAVQPNHVTEGLPCFLCH